MYCCMAPSPVLWLPASPMPSPLTSSKPKSSSPHLASNPQPSNNPIELMTNRQPPVETWCCA